MTEADALRSVSEFRKDEERKLRSEKKLPGRRDLRTRFRTAMGGTKKSIFWVAERERERRREGGGRGLGGLGTGERERGLITLWFLPNFGGFCRLEMRHHDTCKKNLVCSTIANVKKVRICNMFCFLLKFVGIFLLNKLYWETFEKRCQNHKWNIMCICTNGPIIFRNQHLNVLWFLISTEKSLNQLLGIDYNVMPYIAVRMLCKI